MKECVDKIFSLGTIITYSPISLYHIRLIEECCRSKLALQRKFDKLSATTIFEIDIQPTLLYMNFRVAVLLGTMEKFWEGKNPIF